MAMVFDVGMVQRPMLRAYERLPYHRAEIQAFQRTHRYWATGVNPVMVPAGMGPRLAEVYAGFNIWLDPVQGFYWVDGFEPIFGSVEGARAFALTQIPPPTAPEGIRAVIPYALIIGLASALM